MPKGESHPTSSPPDVRTHPEYDVVDAEFTEVDDDRRATRALESNPEPYFSLSQARYRERATPKFLWLAIPLLLIGIVSYRAFLRTDVAQKTEERSVPNGWSDLLMSACAFTQSFDANKWLTLGDDQSVELREALPPEQDKTGNERVSTGKWSYNETSKQYSITINGETTTYTLFSQEGVATCILVRGDFTKANLRESWFATADDDPGDESQ